MLTEADREWIRAEFARLERRQDSYVNAEEREDRKQRQQLIDALQEWRAQVEARLEPVDVLPAAAPLGAVLRKRGTPFDPNLYLGNGQGRPLTKILPTAL